MKPFIKADPLSRHMGQSGECMDKQISSIQRQRMQVPVPVALPGDDPEYHQEYIEYHYPDGPEGGDADDGMGSPLKHTSPDMPPPDCNTSVPVPALPHTRSGGLPKWNSKPFIEEYPGEAGKTFGEAETTFEAIRRECASKKLSEFHVFETEERWEACEFLIDANLSEKKCAQFFKLKGVSPSLSAECRSSNNRFHTVSQERLTTWLEEQAGNDEDRRQIASGGSVAG
jgi:hypothetical protein